jgi:hypothetical protein
MSPFVLLLPGCTRVATGDASPGTLATAAASPWATRSLYASLPAHPNPILSRSLPLFPSSLPWCGGCEQEWSKQWRGHRSWRWSGETDLAEAERNGSGGGPASGGGLAGMNDSRSFRVPHSGDARRRPRCRPATEGRRRRPRHPPLRSSSGSTRSTSAGGFPDLAGCSPTGMPPGLFLPRQLPSLYFSRAGDGVGSTDLDFIHE